MTPEELAANDDPLRAIDLLQASEFPEAKALAEALRARTAHLGSREAYAAFYNEPAPERTYLQEELIPTAHERIPRWGLVKTEVLRQGARTVLELGCFDGFCGLNLALTHRVKCVGVDLNAWAVAECNRRAEKLRVPMRGMVGYAEDACLFQEPPFDAVLCLEILEHVIDIEAVLFAAEQNLAKTGRVYISAPLTAPRHHHVREAREHVRLLDYPRLMALLTAPGRELVWYQRLVTSDGLHHCGAYEVRR